MKTEETYKCPYCGGDTIGSEEHIVPHGLGGSLKSHRVCCRSCNNRLGELVDAPFIQMFAPLCAKMRPLNGMHEFVGSYAVNIIDPTDGVTIRPGIIKNGMVVCSELARMLRCFPRELNLSERDVCSVPLAWDTRDFKNGIAKIAFGFALHNGIKNEEMTAAVAVAKDGRGRIKEVDFKFPIVPFSPLCEFDRFVELQAPCNLYHHIVLFGQGKCLWCYVDLFNTFQFYVLLSSSISEAVLHEHFQYAESLDRAIPTFRHGRSPKDIQIDAMTYGVEPTLDEDELDRRIAIAIRQRSVTDSVDSVLKDYLELFCEQRRQAIRCQGAVGVCAKQSIDVVAGLRDVQYYFDQDEELRHDRYRQTFCNADGVQKSYPDEDEAVYRTHAKVVCEYTQRKFARLWWRVATLKHH